MKKSIIDIFGKKLKNINLNELIKLKPDLRELTPQNIRYILKKPSNERTNEEIAFLKNFCLLKTNFIDKLNQEHMDEETQSIIMLLSMPNAFYKLIYNKDETIYNINEESKYFFIILNGKVTVYDVEKIDCEMNGEEYYKLILDYRNKKEKYLLEKTLKENKVNIPIDINDVNNLDKILLKIYLMSKTTLKMYNDNSTTFLDIIFKKLGFKYSDFDIKTYEQFLEEKNNENKNKFFEYDLNEEIKMNRDNEEKVLDNINLLVNDDLSKKYSFLINTPKIPVSYYRYKIKKVLEEFHYFGDSSSGFYKNKLVSKTNDLELLYFNNDIYNECVLNLRSKLNSTRDQFLLNNFFLNSIPKSTFEKLYLKYFEYTKFYINHTIIEENEPINYLYFVKSGKIKLFSNRSIVQNHLLIDLIINIIKKKCPNITDINTYFNAYSKQKFDFEIIKNEMNLNRDVHIMNIEEKQCIGFECFYFGFNNLYKAVAFSEKVELYRLSMDNLLKILTIKNKKALYDFAILAEKALKILLDRLIVVNNMLILKYTQENKKDVKEVSEMMEKAILRHQIKVEEMRVNRNVINTIKKEQKNIEKTRGCNCNNKNIKNNRYFLKDKFSSLSCPRKTKFDLKKNLIFNKNKLFENVETTKNINNQYNNIEIQNKLFNYKDNLARQKKRELIRESIELGRLSNLENKKINFLKLQNKITCDFVRFSKGEKRIFINSSQGNLNLSSIRHHYSFKKRNIFLNYKNKIKTILPLGQEKKKREFFPKLNVVEEKNIIDTNDDIKIYEKWIELEGSKNIENMSSIDDKEIKSKNKIKIFRKSNDGQNNIYKKFVINNK